MRITLYGTFAISAIAIGLIAADKGALTAQEQRGSEIFLHSAKGTACATCHRLAELGTAVGPDLAVLTSVATVHSMVATIRMTMTNTVLLVKTSNGSFPAVLKQKQGDDSEFWDLSQTPPVLRKLASKEILSSERDTKWQHPPAKAGYTPDELADVISFLRWASTGSQKDVTVSDVGVVE